MTDTHTPLMDLILHLEQHLSQIQQLLYKVRQNNYKAQYQRINLCVRGMQEILLDKRLTEEGYQFQDRIMFKSEHFYKLLDKKPLEEILTIVNPGVIAHEFSELLLENSFMKAEKQKFDDRLAERDLKIAKLERKIKYLEIYGGKISRDITNIFANLNWHEDGPGGNGQRIDPVPEWDEDFHIFDPLRE